MKKLRWILFPFLILGLTLFVWAQKPSKMSTNEKTLSEILDGTARYCEKLKQQVFHFICSEQIFENCEKAYDFPVERQGLKNFFEKNNPERPIENWDSKSKMDRKIDQMKKNQIKANYNYKKHAKVSTFLNEYRIVKDGSRVKEDRTVIRRNGKNVSLKNPGLQTIVYSYKNTLSPIYLFAREHQGSYQYKLLGKQTAMDRDAYAVEVKLKNANKNKGKLAWAWVDAEDFSILKLKVFPPAFQGYEYLLKKAPKGSGEKFDVKVNDLHYFGYQKNGLRFPTKTEINLSYKEEPKIGIAGVKHGAVLLTHLTTVYSYKNYRFFRVTVSEPVFKMEYTN